jgi:glycosyltransferase involved in cell wall biosynthesis
MSEFAHSLAADHVFVALAYGNSPFLPDCLRSLRAQRVQSRIVVATSTPSDDIARAAHGAGAELLVNPQRRGIGADWNFALRAARARLVTLAHQDDIYHPDFAGRTLALFQRHTGEPLCFTGYREITDEGTPRHSKTTAVKRLITAATIGTREVAAGHRLRLFLSFGNPIPCSSVTFDLSCVPGFAFDETLASNLDWEAWWRLHRAGHVFLHCPEPLVGRRCNELSETSRLIRDGRRRQEDVTMFETIWPKPVGRTIAYLYRAGY